MILSMTGYGKSVATINGIVFEIELKSLNSRYLEIALKIPSALQSKEYEIREILRKQIRRGKLFLAINVSRSEQGAANFIYNKDKVAGVLSVFETIRQNHGITGEIGFEHLLSIRDLFAPDFDDVNDNSLSELKAAIEEAVGSLQSMKKAEGQELLTDINSRLTSIETDLSEIEKMYHDNFPEYFDRYRQKVAELIRDFSVNSERLELEVALIAERADIAEECVRLHSHIKMFRENLTKEDTGRKLNFLCQELHREINTISSKTISTEITHLSLNIKEEIERIREQVQNIE